MRAPGLCEWYLKMDQHDCKSCFWEISHLPRRALCAIHRRTFLCFAEVLIVGVAAPQLLARVISPELDQTEWGKKNNCELFRNSLISLLACLLHKQRDCGTFYFLSFWYFFLSFFHFLACFFHISIYSYLTNVYLFNQCFIWLGTHGCAHLVADTKVEAALLVHGIINPRELRKLGPFVLEGIVQQAVVGAEGKDEAPHTSRGKKALRGEKNNRYLYWAHTAFRAKDNTVQRERKKKKKSVGFKPTYWMYLLSSCLLQRDQW